jgi:hypothetical protein
MDPTALYYALSTIAQYAAALAALIGFLGMWRLDRLRDEERRAEDEVLAETLQFSNVGPKDIPYRGLKYPRTVYTDLNSLICKAFKAAMLR